MHMSFLVSLTDFATLVLLAAFFSLMSVALAYITPSLLLDTTFGQFVSGLSTSITKDNFHHTVLFTGFSRQFFCFIKTSQCNLEFAKRQRFVLLGNGGKNGTGKNGTAKLTNMEKMAPLKNALKTQDTK